MLFSNTLSYVSTTTNKRTRMLSFRVSDEELARVKGVAAKVKEKHRFVEEADVLRELLGLEDNGLITKELRKQLLPPPTHKVKDDDLGHAY